jgi:hypothetical protein
MLQPLTINPDGKSMFASPWETYYSSPYVVRTKGGDVPGFATLVFVIPALRISFAATFNGPLNQGALIQPILDALLPAFVEDLTAVQPKYPLLVPGDAQRFCGVYTSDIGMAVKVSTYDVNGATWLLVASAGMSFPVTYVETDGDVTRTQVWVPPHKLSCMMGDELALENEYVLFTAAHASSNATLAIPGFMPGQVFSKTA